MSDDSTWVVFFLRNSLPTLYLENKNTCTICIDEAKQFKTKRQADNALAKLKVDLRFVDLDGYIKQVQLKDIHGE